MPLDSRKIPPDHFNYRVKRRVSKMNVAVLADKIGSKVAEKVENIVWNDVLLDVTELVQTVAEQTIRTPLAEKAYQLTLSLGSGDGEIEYLQFWAVSGWLANKLLAKGEKVDPDFAGFAVWSRTSNDALVGDDVLLRIAQVCVGIGRA